MEVKCTFCLEIKKKKIEKNCKNRKFKKKLLNNKLNFNRHFKKKTKSFVSLNIFFV